MESDVELRQIFGYTLDIKLIVDDVYRTNGTETRRKPL